MWLSRKQPAPPAESRIVDLGRAIVTVKLLDGDDITVTIEGEFRDPYSSVPSCWVTHARQRFLDWRAIGGQAMMLAVGGGEYVPIHLVKRVIVRYEELLKPVSEWDPKLQ